MGKYVNSHLPVLRKLIQRGTVYNIIEYGCGLGSTVEFLRHPQIKLWSIEHNPDWWETVNSHLTDEQRSRWVTVHTKQFDYVPPNILDADLILVDNGDEGHQRITTIKTLAAHRPQIIVPVVIHDFNVDEYRDAAMPFNNRVVFQHEYPHTGVVWYGDRKYFNEDDFWRCDLCD